MKKLVSSSGCQSPKRTASVWSIHAYVDLRIAAAPEQPRYVVNDVSKNGASASCGTCSAQMHVPVMRVAPRALARRGLQAIAEAEYETRRKHEGTLQGVSSGDCLRRRHDCHGNACGFTELGSGTGRIWRSSSYGGRQLFR